MGRRDHRITGTEKYYRSFFGKLKDAVRVLLHVLTEEAVYRFLVILFQFLHGRSHEAGSVTVQENEIGLPDAGKALFRDIRFIEQPEANKRQHGRSPKA